MAMATSPPRYTSLLLVSLLLVLLLTFSDAAPEPASPVSRQLVVQVDDRHGEVDGAATGEEAVSFSTAADERCGDGEREEECLMRRTLVAHTDYIYTQGGNHN